MYSDKALRKALAKARDIQLSEIIVDEDHVFSAKFERKMQRLIKSERKSFYPLVNSFGKRMAVSFVIVTIISITMVMSVTASREKFFEMVQQVFEKYSIITYEIDSSGANDSSDNIDTPFVEYEITQLPEGFVEEEEVVVEEMKAKIIYYRKDNLLIDFYQHPIEDADFMINTEGVTLDELVIDDQPVYYYSNLGIQNVFWDNGEYVFMISGDIPKEDLLNLVKYINPQGIDQQIL